MSDLIPFASVFLISSCLFLLTGRFKNPHTGMVEDGQLPFNNAVCWRDGTGSNPVISIDHNNHLSFGIQEFDRANPTAGTVRVAVIRRVCANHNIKFTAFQIMKLAKLDWLSMNSEAFPNFLSRASQQLKLIKASKAEPINDEQLQEYITAAKMATDAILRRNMSVYLRIDADVKAGKVMLLIDILQEVGINRFELMAQCR